RRKSSLGDAEQVRGPPGAAIGRVRLVANRIPSRYVELQGREPAEDRERRAPDPHWRKAGGTLMAMATSEPTAPARAPNPLTAGMPQSLIPQPCVLVIFGAAGDLSWRKLLPALYNLNVDGVLPSNFAMVGFGVGEQGDPDDWIRSRARDGIEHFSRQALE